MRSRKKLYSKKNRTENYRSWSRRVGQKDVEILARQQAKPLVQWLSLMRALPLLTIHAVEGGPAEYSYDAKLWSPHPNARERRSVSSSEVIESRRLWEHMLAANWETSETLSGPRCNAQ